MNDYVIFVDSACDIAPEILDQWGVKYESLTFRFVDSNEEFYDTRYPAEEFYKQVLAGRMAKTAAVNTETFRASFEKILQEGLDLLYLGFSSGLSSTFDAGRMALKELQEEYPDRHMAAVDSLSASAGYGLLLYLTVQKKKEGASLEEAARFAEDTRLHLCHWFTVDDLKYLRMGGRISSATAIIGGMLNIKPVLHMDDEGHLINMTKVRGRKMSIKALAEKAAELASDSESPVYISHGACPEDALELKRLMEEKGRRVELITSVGPVIGSHSGPGTLALFFLGVHR